MPFKGFRRRSSSETSSSASSAATTPNSATQPSPLSLAVACPSILEHPFDGDDDVIPNAPGEAEAFDGVGDTSGSQIEIGDEQIDLNPFDPSISDELRFQERMQLQAAAEAAANTSPQSFPERFRRVFGSSSSPSSKTPRRLTASSSSSGGGPSSPPAPWRMSFHRRRSSLVDTPLVEADEEEDYVNAAQGLDHSNHRRGIVEDPGVVLLRTSRAGTPDKWGLVPLAQAQSREDIVRRPEGYEMGGPKSTRM